MKTLLTIRNILIAIPLLILLVALSYALPQVDVVRAVGVEIKRVDASDSASGQQRTRDVYQLQMETPDGEPRVYRNEDNYLYGKFDSANLQAQVQSLATDKQLVALRHYGWRITWFSAFPNALKAWPVEPGYRHIPVFNTLVLLGLAALGFFGVRRVRRATQSRGETRRLRDAERAERDAKAAREAEAAARQSREAQRKDISDIDHFLNSGSDKKD
ncbi:hypothetical protein P775_13865 [Puniceibacterium antarcticum]|uniref:DUF1523 domain-containing protein n=1 Tax=Puniceibacterium antarcticum TaxID=1206336 RepID=A0A2G8RDE8_9RHOB|nr:DUF1523 family protein [Puniceibacterium antarcticum]PIL19606.1 hypothetical protein P775_13865 [Puniceibacterium antarcticum]